MERVLVIDDNAGVRTLIREMLEQAGFEVEEAADGKAGMDLYDTRPAAVVVTDIFMPRYDGVETIIALRRAHPDVKIIAISGVGGSGAMGYLSYASKFGAQRVLAKPICEAHLLDALRDIPSDTKARRTGLHARHDVFSSRSRAGLSKALGPWHDGALNQFCTFHSHSADRPSLTRARAGEPASRPGAQELTAERARGHDRAPRPAADRVAIE